jgi:tRNA-specific 2-thiouridylase
MADRERVVLGFSGGVDSFAAARLLEEQGFEVVACFLVLGGAGDDILRERARAAAAILGLELWQEDLSGLFAANVIDYLKAAYTRGETPNPCVSCNAFVKFTGLAAVADRLGIARLATGHYCRRSPGAGREAEAEEMEPRLLLRAADRAKDQSYFLCRVPAVLLSRTLFPLGEFPKARVRELAAAAGLKLSGYRESQELCFLNGEDYRDFLRREGRAASRPGEIVLFSGEVVGRHRGLENYTVGQRRGLDIAWSEPLYVIKLDFAENRLVVGPRSVAGKREFWVRELNWAGPAPCAARSVFCQIRHRHTPAPAVIEPTPQAGFYRVEFEKPQFAVAPGQAAAFFQGDALLGGGVICRPERVLETLRTGREEE